MPSALAVVRPPGANMVNPKLRYCVLASRCWAEGDSSRVWAGKFPQRASKLRHSCNRFQRVSNWGRYRPGTAESF
jgi:hypothetical protein